MLLRERRLTYLHSYNLSPPLQNHILYILLGYFLDPRTNNLLKFHDSRTNNLLCRANTDPKLLYYRTSQGGVNRAVSYLANFVRTLYLDRDATHSMQINHTAIHTTLKDRMRRKERASVQ